MIAALLSLLALPIWFGASTVVQSYVCLPPATPVINSPVAGSTVIPDIQVTIEGTSTADSTVTLTDNGDVFATITADEFEYFATQTSFTTGAHLLGVTSQNPCGSSAGSDVSITAEAALISGGSLPGNSSGTLGLTSLSEPIKAGEFSFRIVSPRNNSTTTGASIYVAGTTSALTTQRLFINDKMVANISRANTSFGVTIPLSVGRNILRIVITDAANSTNETEEVSLNITRKPIRNDSSPPSSTNTYQSWYKTQGGKIALIVAVIFILIVIGIFLFL